MHRLVLLFLLALVWAGSCAHAPPAVVTSSGPTGPAPLRIEACTVSDNPGWKLISPHYLIYSTVPDRQSLERVGQVMEGALGVYRSIAPQVPPSERPMECYIFATRQQWAAFTKKQTGDDAAIYLRVNRGGYTVGDWYVAYWIGSAGTFSVAAHEGWHQYVARHLVGRLPPFLEEGLACMFEQVQWEGDLPRWDLTQNAARLSGLRAALDADRLQPLSALVEMHAGQVVGQPSERIEAFYAQSWAFARFLYDGHSGRYRPALQRMLADAARGTLHGDTSRQLGRAATWDPHTARPMLEHYLGVNLAELDGQYQRYIRSLAGT